MGEYFKCPSGSTPSVALIPGIFTGKTISSNVVITMNIATYGSGTDPSSNTFSIYNSSACATQVTASQSGTLPTSKTYTNAIYTITQSNASIFTDDLAIKITKPGKQIRLKSIKVEFSYSTPPPKVVSSITIDSTNVKKSFEVGDEFTYSGLVVTAHYTDTTSAVINTGYDVSNPVMNTTGNKTITVTYESCTASYTINVKAAKSLTSISLSGQTTSFTEGDEFEFGGTVTAHFNDSTSLDVTSDATFEGFSMTVPGGQMVAVSYTYKGVTESTTYSINVSVGTLSSISLNGQTTEFLKNHPFEFDGTCTAIFENGYQKQVTPTSVSSPDMSKAGQKTVTVTFTYNGTTVQTTYQIVVSANRTVIEETTTEQEDVLETISYPNNTAPSLTYLSTSTSGYTTIEENSIRLGSGSNTGSITVTVKNGTMTKIVVNAKVYGSDTGVSLTIGGSSNTLTSQYTDYIKEFSTPVSSCIIATTTNKKRANIQSITVYTTKNVKVETDITNTSDCVGLETFIDTYLHMSYVENLGYCKDTEHHYYSTAKSAFNSLNDHQRTLFTSNSAYSNEWMRLSSWATANGESLNSSNILAESSRTILQVINIKNTSAITILIICLIGGASIGAYFFIKKKEEDR